MALIRAMTRGFCNEEPKSEAKSVGTKAMIVVKLVMTMERSRLTPAVWMASWRGIPCRLRLLIMSSFKTESLTMIPHATTIERIAREYKDKQGKGYIDRYLHQDDYRL